MRRVEREISDTHEIEEIIQKADVCRIALANESIPYIVTMNFGYTNNPEQTFYFHSANDGKKLDMIRRNKYVCFEMDTEHKIFMGKRSCDWGMNFSSIIGYGNIAVISEKKEKITGMNCIMEHYGGNGEYLYDDKIFEHTTILRLDILEMTGKKR
jgi:nitroimidazol reductase NimA-like FMN-containing flavoprotein (pyridoxamine 5'-phosphate oxidase superfamily)